MMEKLYVRAVERYVVDSVIIGTLINISVVVTEFVLTIYSIIDTETRAIVNLNSDDWDVFVISYEEWCKNKDKLNEEKA